MTKVILDETEWMQLTCKVSELTKEIAKLNLNDKQLSQENLKLLNAIEARDEALAKLEIENRNLKLKVRDLEREVERYELIIDKIEVDINV